MKVERFDTQNGIYCFEESNLSTGFHAHPAIEIIRALEGHFAITTKDTSYSQLTMAAPFTIAESYKIRSFPEFTFDPAME